MLAVKQLIIAAGALPWTPAVQALLPIYKKQTGVNAIVDTYPYGGLLTKELNAVTLGTSEHDIIFMGESLPAEVPVDESDFPVPEIFVMIETLRVLENLEDIAATPRISGLYVGPVDLGLAMGRPYPLMNQLGLNQRTDLVRLQSPAPIGTIRASEKM